MENGIFDCPAAWRRLLPTGVRRLETMAEVAAGTWNLMALTGAGCRSLGKMRFRCRELLLPGDCPPALLTGMEAETVISYGLSPRDSVTFSSLREPVLCVQRVLPRPDGGLVEPQEIPLPALPGPAVELLPLLAVRLLQMPQTASPFLW